MKWAAIILILVFLTAAARADSIAVVKQTRNSQGVECSEIPRYVENKHGFKARITEWFESKVDGIMEVTLKVTAQKESAVDTMYVSYSWDPEWIWGVKRSSKKVEPINQRARNWMKGII